jgi:hypothetical protein
MLPTCRLALTPDLNGILTYFWVNLGLPTFLAELIGENRIASQDI